MIKYGKSIVFLAALLPCIRLAWLGAHDGLGANPVEFIIRSLGTWALIFLLISLSITPIRQLSGASWPMHFRRMLGLFVYFYACLHMLSYAGLDLWFDWAAISGDIVKHPYVLVGLTALLMLTPLAITSNQVMMKRMGRHWKSLHRSVYLISIFAILHYWWLVKKDFREPLLYTVILIGLFAIRLIHNYRKAGHAAFPFTQQHRSKTTIPII